MNKQDTKEAIINAYRDVIVNLYQYDTLTQNHELPSSFDEERVVFFRNFFLDYIYPPPAKRAELEAAFESLDDYIKSPEKLLRILLDSASLLFKYGRYLPKILRAGLGALHSFRMATHFENSLITKALESELEAPYSIADINKLVTMLPMSEIDRFIDSSYALFKTLHDRELVGKIVEIVKHLIAKMKKRPNIYSEIEINGLEIGKEMIEKGNKLFDQLSIDEQEIIFEKIVEIQRKWLESLFAEKENT